MNYCCIPMLLAVIATVRANNLESRFRADYPSASISLQKAASHVRCEVDCNLGGQTERVMIYVNGDKALIERFATSSTDRESFINKVQCYTPKHFFSLSRSRHDGPLLLNAAYPSSKVGEIDLVRLSMFTEAARAAFCVDGLVIGRLVTSNSFKIDRISEIDNDGSSSVLVLFRCDDPNLWVASGRLVFRPDLGWALSEYELRRKEKISTQFPKYKKIAGHVTARELSSGRVLPTESRSRTFDGKGEAGDPIHLTVLNVSFEDVPDSKFKTSAYGLPDLPDVTEAPHHGWVYLLLGVAFATITILFILQSKRHGQTKG